MEEIGLHRTLETETPARSKIHHPAQTGAIQEGFRHRRVAIHRFCARLGRWSRQTARSAEEIKRTQPGESGDQPELGVVSPSQRYSDQAGAGTPHVELAPYRRVPD